MKRRLDLRNEADWLPLDMGDLEQLRRRFALQELSIAEANGLTGWLVAKALGERDTTSPTTRAKYRKILADLGEPPWDGDDERRRHLLEAGNADLRTVGLVAAASAGGAALAAGHPVLALVVAPIILDESVTSSSGEVRLAA